MFRRGRDGGLGLESLPEEGEAVAGETGAGSTLSKEATEGEHDCSLYDVI